MSTLEVTVVDLYTEAYEHHERVAWNASHDTVTLPGVPIVAHDRDVLRRETDEARAELDRSACNVACLANLADERNVSPHIYSEYGRFLSEYRAAHAKWSALVDLMQAAKRAEAVR